MAIQNAYVKSVVENLEKCYPNEPEYLQAVEEFLEPLQPVIESDARYEKLNVLGRMVEAERTVVFSVPWVNDQGEVVMNHGYRLQHSSALGPYKGGLRFHPSVNLSVIKFLGFEQTFKDCLTGLPMGGGKGGADFDPKGKSEAEVMRFCQAFMNELHRHIGEDTDVPAGDIGVGGREIGYMFGQYKKLQNRFTGALTGKSLACGGSLARTEATGFGLCYFAAAMMKDHNESFAGKRVIISGSGNVATYANQKCTELGGKVIAMSDSCGYIVDENGIDYKIIQQIKEVKRERISTYVNYVPGARYVKGCSGIWTVPCDIAMPCATQNEISAESAKALIANGCFAVFEGSNMPCTPDAINAIKAAGLLYSPSKASNAGGVAVSGLEMSQNSERLSWSFEEVDAQLKNIMENIYHSCAAAAAQYGMSGDIQAGANIASFLKVADAMLWQGVS